MNKFLDLAVNEAKKGVKNKEGGPFGAVIVKNGKVVSSAHNLVLKTKDPTAHAEISAIRKASKKLKTFDLTGCEIYVTAEPCPMCLFAIQWARIGKVVYGASAKEVGRIGFRDEKFYDFLNNKKRSKLKLKKVKNENASLLLKEFNSNPNKKLY
jgi:tRNA(Arg) A34 adenosine deaminase TadA